MKRDIVLEHVYEFPPERIWRALTDPKAIAAWLMENDFEPRLGHKFQFRAQPMPGWNGIVDSEVIELDKPRRLAYTWESGGHSTAVIWILDPVPEGTRLRLEHTGFEGPHGQATLEMLRSGWKKMLAETFGAIVASLDASGLTIEPALADRSTCHPPSAAPEHAERRDAS